MKNLSFFAVMLIMASAIFTSCASRKQVAQPTHSQKMAEERRDYQDQLKQMEYEAKLKEIERREEEKELEHRRKMTELQQRPIIIEVPCKDASFDDSNYFRDLGVGTHEGNNYQACRYAAVQAAKEMVKLRLSEFIQGFSPSYIGNYTGTKERNAIESTIKNRFNSIVEKMLNDADKECEEKSADAKGNIVVYYVVRISKKDLKKQFLDVLAQEEKDRTDYNAYLTQKEMDERWEEMSNAKKAAGY